MASRGLSLGEWQDGISLANTFVCHVRLKRSGAWWYEINSNQMLALRCAKYNGTFDQVFAGYQQRLPPYVRITECSRWKPL
jgi:hypothetical protein